MMWTPRQSSCARSAPRPSTSMAGSRSSTSETITTPGWLSARARAESQPGVVIVSEVELLEPAIEVLGLGADRAHDDCLGVHIMLFRTHHRLPFVPFSGGPAPSFQSPGLDSR